MSPEGRYWKFRQLVRDTLAYEPVELHINNLFMASNRIRLEDLRTSPKLEELTSKLRYGLGPRAAKDLLLGAKGWKLFFSDGSTTTAQADDLAMVIMPVLRHRLKVDPGFLEKQYLNKAKGRRERLIDHFIKDLAVECAPTKDGYHARFKDQLEAILEHPSY
jgi:hypothetical protein